MIVTRDFVFISNPRTGSSFVRNALRAAYGPDWSEEGAAGAAATELTLPVRRGAGINGQDHHGTLSQIPLAHADKRIISVVRNPYTLLVSLFELGLWHRRASLGSSSTTFEAFLRAQADAARARWGIAIERENFGPLSLHFVQMFASNPQKAFAAISSGASVSEVGREIPLVTFLRQEQLIGGLCETLGRWLSVAQLERLSRVRPTHITARSRPWSPAMFHSGLGEAIRCEESFIFHFLAERGIVYSLDNADFTQPERPSSPP